MGHIAQFQVVNPHSSFWPSSVTVQAGLCQTWSKSPDDQFSYVVAKITMYHEIAHLHEI